MALLKVEDFLAAGELFLQVLVGGAGLSRAISSENLTNCGLHLTGFFEHFHPERIHLLGRAEQAYLASLPVPQRVERLRSLLERRPAALVVSAGGEVPKDVEAVAAGHGVALLLTPLEETEFVARAARVLQESLAPTTTVHGVLMDVFGVGILMMGESGIGKSEVALDLILRGHRFIADDVVDVSLRPPATLIGRGAELIQHHIEIRGLGILNVKDLFGVAAVRDQKKIELVVELIAWAKSEAVDRTGLDEKTSEILGVHIPHLQIPVSPGRNITSIVEVAARNRLLQMQGIHSAREFQEKLLKDLSERAAPSPEGDVE